jgi:hypothetical protein
MGWLWIFYPIVFAGFAASILFWRKSHSIRSAQACISQEAARWLRDRMDSTEDIFLLGNHDAAYMFADSDELYCPGFTRAKSRGIHEVLKAEHWARFKLAHEEQGWLLSHAAFIRSG